MSDRDLRTWEREWQADPGDLDALQRVVLARRRMGLPITGAMRERQVAPARRFDADLPLEVHAVLEDGRARHIGRTPTASGDGVHLPPHRWWWVQPLSPTDTSLAALAASPIAGDITGLSLRPDVTARGLASLAAFPALELLDLGACSYLTDASLDSVGAVASLEVLSLWSVSRLTDAGLDRLAHLTRLVSLDLRNLTKVRGEGLAALSHLGALHALYLSGCTSLRPSSLRALGDLTNLAMLDLSRTPFDAAAAAHLAPLRELTLLNLAHTKFAPAGIAHLLSLPSLAQVVLIGCPDAAESARSLKAGLPRCDVVA